MAIKVNGTTVIDDSRNLVNIASGAGSSTTVGAVGTYAFLTYPTTQTAGYTVSANSSLYWVSASGDKSSSPSLSGTWQLMGYCYGGGNQGAATVWVRIS